MRKFSGYTLLVISSLAWVAVFVVPFVTVFSTAEKASWAAGIYVSSQVTWWLGVGLLGREFLEWSRQFWQTCKQRIGFSSEHLQKRESTDR